MADISRNISETLRNIDLKQPALSTLAKKGNETLVQRFLTENVQLGDDEKETMQSQLYIASFWGFADVVKTLLENGADVNAQNERTFWTPLHAASFQEHGKVVMMLLQSNGDPWLEDFEGRTPVDFGSASDKIWPMYASCGCTRTAKSVLIEKGVLKKPNASNTIPQPVNQDASTLRKSNMASLLNYDTQPLDVRKADDRSIYAASIDGDVLAGDHKKTLAPEQPSFNAWRN